ncbi:hypothetical protein F2A05_08875, partial [Alistipes onderdonkii]
MCATTGTGRCSTTWDAASRSSGRKSRSPAGLKFAGDNGNIRYFAVIGAFRLHWQTRPGGALPGTTGKGDRRDFGAYNHDNKYKKLQVMEETIKCLIIGSGPAGYTAAIYT